MKKDYSLWLLLMVLGVAFMAAGGLSVGFIPDEAPMYQNGEILYPDMVHDDTLVVVDAGKLGHEVRQSDGTDEDIDFLLHKYCVKK